MNAALILAAGASRRMGSPKALLPWAGTTLLGAAIREARAAGADEIVVVLGQAASMPSPTGVKVVFNPDEASGRSGSIRLGVAALASNPAAILIQSVDQPCPAAVLQALYDGVSRAEVVIPTYGGRRGHPVCFAGRLLPELRSVDEASQGLRAVVRAHPVREVPVASEAVLWNLNDPSAYAAALGRLRSG
jgi:CTP:molybdopterin cytidylyltransferase MocA